MVLLLALVLVLAACGGGESSGSSSSEGDKAEKEETKKEEDANKDEAKEDAKEDEKEDAKEDKKKDVAPVTGGKTIELVLWDMVYDADTWTYDEDYISDYETLSEVQFKIPGATDDDNPVVKVVVSAYTGDASDFRNRLYLNGFDEYEYAVNNAYDRVDISGVECVKFEGEEWGTKVIKYIGRNEGAGTTLSIGITGDVDDERIDSLVAGLTLKLEDTGNVDPPWPWEGERFTAETQSQLVGTLKINSEYLPFDEPLITRDIFEQKIGVIGNKAYVVSDDKLLEYDFDGASLKFVKEHDLGRTVENISVTDDGSIWVSSFMEPLIQIKDGEVVGSYDTENVVAMSPSGKWGISYFTEAKFDKLTFEDGMMTRTEMDLTADIDLLFYAQVDENHIYLGGNSTGDDDYRVFVYDPEGNLELKLEGGGDFGLGSVTFMAETENGFIGLDGNMREICLWNKEGKWIGSVEDSGLFGTSYPWLCGGYKMPSGEIMVILTQERADESAEEALVYKVNGF